MKIAKMNTCIRKMREIYNFDDEKTEIMLGDYKGLGKENRVRLWTKDDNGTEITLSRDIEHIAELPSLEDEDLEEDD